MFANSLIKVLKEWDESVKDSKLTDMGGLISVGLLHLGSEDFKEDGYHANPYRFLENRILQLQKNEGVFEEFIVDGLLSLFYKHFKDQVNKREEYIYNNENLIKSAIKLNKAGGDIPVNFIKDTEDKILLLNSPEYLTLAKNELKAWEEISSRVFSDENRNEMERNIMIENHARYKEQMPEEERKRLNEIIDKMR
ncbi:hypothetical protein [Fictibacillus sp. 18YEL24]|uniref:hypothetical protein n=1 Tax=Fictibacillus sp. 18YEL24 TaxID=2745875 RepID=UPI0018CDD0BF|nr:hypothetical protein [Fictibacillus sp. 18YEL24]MBH0171037.1 hypothetical protein [Fictibacillus sp. 18YEL24]